MFLSKKLMGRASDGNRYDDRTKQYGDRGGGGPPMGQKVDSFRSLQGGQHIGRLGGNRESFGNFQGAGGPGGSLGSGRNPQNNREFGSYEGHQRGGGNARATQQKESFNSRGRDGYSQGRNSYVDRSNDRSSNRDPDQGRAGSMRGVGDFKGNRNSFGTNQGGRALKNEKASFGSNDGAFGRGRASFGTNLGGRPFESDRSSFGPNQWGRASENDRASFGSNQGSKAFESDRTSFSTNQRGRAFGNDRSLFGPNQGGRAIKNDRASFGSNQGGMDFENNRESFGPNQGGRAFEGGASFGSNQRDRAFENDTASFGHNQGGRAYESGNSYGPNKGGRANESGDFYGPNEGGGAHESRHSYGPNQGGRTFENDRTSFGPNQGGKPFENERASFGPNQGGRVYEDRGSYGPNQGGKSFDSDRTSFGRNQGGRAFEDGASYDPNQGGRGYENDRTSFGPNQGSRAFINDRASFGPNQGGGNGENYGHNQGGQAFDSGRASFGPNQGARSFEGRNSFGPNQGGRAFESDRSSFGPNQGGGSFENNRATFGPNQGGRSFENNRASFGSNQGGSDFESNSSFGPNQGGRAFEGNRAPYGGMQGGEGSFNQTGRGGRGSYNQTGRGGEGSYTDFQARNEGYGHDGGSFFNSQSGPGHHHGGNAPHMGSQRDQDGSGWRNDLDSQRPNMGQNRFDVMSNQQNPGIQNNPPCFNEYDNDFGRWGGSCEENYPRMENREYPPQDSDNGRWGGENFSGIGNAGYPAQYERPHPGPNNMQGPRYPDGGGMNKNMHPSGRGNYRRGPGNKDHQLPGQGVRPGSRKRPMEYKKGPIENKKARSTVMSRLGPRAGGPAKGPGQKSIVNRLGPKENLTHAVVKKLSPAEAEKLATKHKDFPPKGLSCNMCNQHKFTDVSDYLRHQETWKHCQQEKSTHFKINATYKFLLSQAQLAYGRKFGALKFDDPWESICEVCEVPNLHKTKEGAQDHRSIKECITLHQYVNPHGCCSAGDFSSRLLFENHCLTLAHLKRNYTAMVKQEESDSKERERLSKLKTLFQTGTEASKCKVKYFHNAALGKLARVYQVFGKDPIPKEIDQLLKAYEFKDMRSVPGNLAKFPSRYFDPSYPQGKFQVMFETEFECNVCCIILDRSKQGIIDHCLTKEHYDNVLKKQEKMKVVAEGGQEEKDEKPIERKGKDVTEDATEGGEEEDEGLDIYDDPFELDKLFDEGPEEDGGEQNNDDEYGGPNDDIRLDDCEEEDALDYEDELDFEEACESVKKGKTVKSQAKGKNIETEPSGLGKRKIVGKDKAGTLNAKGKATASKSAVSEVKPSSEAVKKLKSPPTIQTKKKPKDETKEEPEDETKVEPEDETEVEPVDQMEVTGAGELEEEVDYEDL